MYYDSIYEDKNIKEIVSEKMKNVFLILTTALLVTLGVVIGVNKSPKLYALVDNSYFLIVILFFIISLAFSLLTFKASKTALLIMLYSYSVINGFLLSVITVLYTYESVISVLAGTIVLTVVLSIYGYLTKQDLTKFSSLLFGGLIALIVMGLVNMFLFSAKLEMFLSFLGVFIFMLYIAYDVNVIKNNITKLVAVQKNDDILDRIAIIGAFSLYLDFINLFLYLLRLFGNSND